MSYRCGCCGCGQADQGGGAAGVAVGEQREAPELHVSSTAQAADALEGMAAAATVADAAATAAAAEGGKRGRKRKKRGAAAGNADEAAAAAGDGKENQPPPPQRRRRGEAAAAAAEKGVVKAAAEAAEAAAAGEAGGAGGAAVSAVKAAGAAGAGPLPDGVGEVVLCVENKTPVGDAFQFSRITGALRCMRILAGDAATVAAQGLAAKSTTCTLTNTIPAQLSHDRPSTKAVPLNPAANRRPYPLRHLRARIPHAAGPTGWCGGGGRGRVRPGAGVEPHRAVRLRWTRRTIRAAGGWAV